MSTSPQILLALWLIFLLVVEVFEQLTLSIEDSRWILLARLLGVFGRYFIIVSLTYRGGFWNDSFPSSLPTGF